MLEVVRTVTDCVAIAHGHSDVNTAANRVNDCAAQVVAVRARVFPPGNLQPHTIPGPLDQVHDLVQECVRTAVVLQLGLLLRHRRARMSA